MTNPPAEAAADSAPTDPTSERPPERDLNALITRMGVAAWSIVGAAVLIWIGLQVLIRFDILLAPIVLSVALIYILNPLVNLLAARRVPRIIAAFLAFLVMLAVVAGIGLAVTPLVADQASELANRFPEIYDDTVAEIEDLAASLGFEDVDLWSYD
nr:AI-2E family transporter [Acidimicrobiia bacterium]